MPPAQLQLLLLLPPPHPVCHERLDDLQALLGGHISEAPGAANCQCTALSLIQARQLGGWGPGGDPPAAHGPGLEQHTGQGDVM